MPRYKMTIEYDGRGFVGWQRQAVGISVQGVLEAALTQINHIPVSIQGAGRTDSGVHALGQVAHADLVRSWTPYRLREAVNALMRPHLVCAREVEEVPDSFEARFSAIRRHYTYRILNRRARPALLDGYVWHVPMRLDVEKMQEASQYLLGGHDFTTFRASECQASSPIRTLERCDVSHVGEEVHIQVAAQSFLHNQVRSITGSLVQVGLERWQPRDLKAALQACDRTRCGPVAPAMGLYFMQVEYGSCPLA